MRDDEPDGREQERTVPWSLADGEVTARQGTSGRGGEDRDVLLALLAFQNGFIELRSLLDAILDWTGRRGRPMGAILLGRGDLDAGQLAALGPLVDQHLGQSCCPGGPGFALPGGSDPVETVPPAYQGTTQVEMPGDPAPAPAPPEDGPAPDRSGCRYRIIKHHAKGGLGDVYIAFDEELRRKVALKEIQARHASSPQNRARFLLEGEVTGSLEHPGIVPVHGLGTYPDGRPFYAMKFIKGESLKQAIARSRARADAGGCPDERALGLRRLLRRFLDVCNAIEYAHSRGVLHRDLKPANIMLGKFGETLVVDWGLAKIVDQPGPGESSTLDDDDDPIRPSSNSGVEPTRMEAIYGTPQYMSPEQASGRIDRIGATSDVYGLGATLYCLLAGRAPFPDEPLAKIKEALLRGDFPRPARVDPTVAPALESICLKAMAPKPEDRYPSARELADDVERWMADEPVTAHPDPPAARLARWTRRHKSPVAVAAAFLVASTIGLAIFSVLVGIERDKARRDRDNVIKAGAQHDQILTFARQAIDSLMTGVASDRLLGNSPQMQEFRGYLADEAVKAAVKLLRPQPDDLAALGTAAPIYHRAAVIHRLLGRYPQAFDEFRVAIRLYKRLIEATPGDRNYRDILARVFLDYAEGLRMSGDAEAALKLYDQARLAAERMRDASPGDTLHEQTLARAHYNKAEILIDAGRLTEAGEAEEAAIALLDRKVARNPSDDIDRYLRTYPLRGRGIVAREQGKVEASAAAFGLALKGLDELEARGKGNNNVDYLRASILDEQGQLLARDAARLAEAERSHDRAIEILERLADQFAGITFYRPDLAVALIHRATLHARIGEGRKTDAVADAGRAAKILEEYLAANPRTDGAHGRLGEALGLLGRLEADPARARGLLERAEGEQKVALTARPPRPRDREAQAAHRRALDGLARPAP